MKSPPSSSPSSSSILRKTHLSPFLFTLLAFIVFVTILYSDDFSCIFSQLEYSSLSGPPNSISRISEWLYSSNSVLCFCKVFMVSIWMHKHYSKESTYTHWAWWMFSTITSILLPTKSYFLGYCDPTCYDLFYISIRLLVKFLHIQIEAYENSMLTLFWIILVVKNKKLPFAIGETKDGCDVFSGSWVHDDSRPLYEEAECPYIQPQLTCQEHGRPDKDYQHWRWQPHGCSLPRHV